MPARTSYEKAVCPFVKRMHCDKTEESSVQIFTPYERPLFCHSYVRKRMVGWGDPFYVKFWAKLITLEKKRWFSVDSFVASQQ